MAEYHHHLMLRMHFCIENVGHMGKEPEDTFLPHRVDYRTVAVLHMSDVLLTWMVGGLVSISNCLHNAFYHQCFLFTNFYFGR